MSDMEKDDLMHIHLENRSATNRKIRIDERSFAERGLTVLSYGVTGFSESVYWKTVCARVCVNIRMDDGLDYDHARIDVGASLMDAENKEALKRSVCLYDCCSIDIPADAASAASVIEIAASGDIPSPKSIGGSLFVIDTASFEKRGISPVSAGITEDVVSGTRIITVLLELSVINAHMLSVCRQLKVFASFRDRENAVIRNVYTDLPITEDGNLSRLVRLAYATDIVRRIGSVRLSVVSGDVIREDDLTEMCDAKGIKPVRRRKKKPPVIVQDDDDDDLSLFSMSGFDGDDDDDYSAFSVDDDDFDTMLELEDMDFDLGDME